MAKKPVYHLDECETCAHRHVCKHVEFIDKLLKSGKLPLDLSAAACNEFIPEDVVDEDWKQYQQEDYIEEESLFGAPITAPPLPGEEIEEINPAELMANMNGALADILSQGVEIDAIYINQNTMEIMKQYYGAKSDLVSMVLVTGVYVAIRIDNELETGYFAVQMGGGM